MEVGAVKQAFNNEIILLKKNLNQAKTQTIHKLTRKAKQLVEKKAPDEIKEKLKRKAESAVKEVLIIKKIKPRDIAQFIVTHKGVLNEYMNKPLDKDKACARLLLHKAMQDKYKHIREKFSNVSIKDLFMSRQERLKLKKEAREKQNKKKVMNKAVSIEGEWKVETTDTNKASDMVQPNVSEDENMSNGVSDGHLSEAESEGDLSNEDVEDIINDDSDKSEDDDESLNIKRSDELDIVINSNKKKLQKAKKPKENKNKNLNKKLQNREFNKECDDINLQATKIVDPFFITSSGENYMSLVEPRQPDEVKEVHKQGNRKYRRAVMFGHEPRPEVRKNFDDRQNNFDDRKNNFDNRKNNFDNRKNNFDNRKNNFDNRKNNFNNEVNNFDDGKNNYDNKNRDGPKQNSKFDKRKNDMQSDVPEKLHPSWEAKKKQSSILPFQGKKIVFDS